jgi:zinc protease
VGDFDPEACVPVIKSALDGWKAAQPTARIANPIQKEPVATEHKINTPDKANAVYAAGLLFPMRDDDPDYPALVMGNYIFGGGSLSSRLGTRIRQKEGLSYSVGATLSVSSFDKRAELGISAICNPNNIGKVETAAKEELQRLLRDGVTEEELEKGREGWLQSRKVARSTDTALAGSLAGLSHLGRTMAYEDEMESKVKALTAAEVHAALGRHLDPAKLVVVTAGDFEGKSSGGGE